MRTESEMYAVILDIAKADDRVLAVYMNGSRANPNVAKDPYRDYDIVYVVDETRSWIEDQSWIEGLGDLAIVQEPDSNDCDWGSDVNFENCYTWLMRFKDGTRIDLHIETVEENRRVFGSDTLTVVLLDKGQILPQVPAPSDIGYHVKAPTISAYRGCTNEFWWCLDNVAKGSVRGQLPYAMWMYNVVIHPMLCRMIDWYIGVHNDFSVSVGMKGKYYQKYLPETLYAQFIQTYAGGDFAALWQSVFIACDLFDALARDVAQHLNFSYISSEPDHTIPYLKEMYTIWQGLQVDS